MYFLYKNIFYYPRIAFIQSSKDFYSVGLVNNIYGNMLPPLELLSKIKKEELIRKLKTLGVLKNKNIAA